MLGHYFLHHSLTFVGTLCRSYFPAIVYRPSFNKSKSGSGTINAKCEQINFLPIYTKNLLRFIMAAAIFRCRNMRMGPIAAFVLQINLKSTQCIEVNRYWPASTAFMRCVTWRLADVDCLVRTICWHNRIHSASILSVLFQFRKIRFAVVLHAVRWLYRTSSSVTSLFRYRPHSAHSKIIAFHNPNIRLLNQLINLRWKH